MQSQMQYDMMSAFKDMMPIEVKEPTPIEEVASYKPEKSWNYEIGIRSELLFQRLSAELTGFYMDIQDVQLTKFVNSGNGRYPHQRRESQKLRYRGLLACPHHTMG